jgi:hypothetical protein
MLCATMPSPPLRRAKVCAQAHYDESREARRIRGEVGQASPDFSHNVGVIAGSHSLSCRFFNAQRFAVAH